METKTYFVLEKSEEGSNFYRTPLYACGTIEQARLDLIGMIQAESRFNLQKYKYRIVKVTETREVVQ